MRIAAIIGRPASGKSTLTREIMSRLSMPIEFKEGLVVGTRHEKSKVIVLGKYGPDEKFPGTDRLSMAVQPAAEEFLLKLSKNERDWNVLFEGDRLGNRKFLEYCLMLGEGLRVYQTEVSEITLDKRHVSRGDTQTDVFKKGRKTKIENIRRFINTQAIFNETPEDLQVNASDIYTFLVKGR